MSRERRYTVLACVVVVSVFLFVFGQGKLALCISLLFSIFAEHRNIESIEEASTLPQYIQRKNEEEEDDSIEYFEHPQYKEEIRAFEKEGVSFFTPTRKE